MTTFHHFLVNEYSGLPRNSFSNYTCIIVAVTSSGILKAKQKIGVTFNFDKQDIIDFMKFSKMTMCRASEANS
jgi:hypothetical protein